MAEEADDMRAGIESEPGSKTKPEEIRAQMAITRSALTEKIEALEEKVMGTVEKAEAAVEQIIEVVQETVQDTVATLKRTLDLKYQVDQRPWTTVGVSVLAGYAVGHLGRGEPHDRTSVAVSANGAQLSGRSPGLEERASSPPGAVQPRQPSLKSGLLSQFDQEIGKVQSVAIGTAMCLFRDWLKQKLPRMAPQLDELMNSATRKLGAEPTAGP